MLVKILMISKKILTITTMSVLVTSIMLISMADVAQANGTDTKELKCEEIIGSFFPPGALIFSSGVGDCSELGEVSFASVSSVAGAGSAANCVALTSPTDNYLVSEKGFITIATTGPLVLAGPVPAADQCFYTDAALSIPASPLGLFCGAGATDPAFSTIAATFSVTGGIVDDKTVTGGSGTISGVVDHCAMSGAPFGNASVASIMGTIDLSDGDDDDDDDDETD